MKLKYRGLWCRYDAVGKLAVDAISKAVRFDLYARALMRAVYVGLLIYLGATGQDGQLAAMLRHLLR
jgi:hypothetical protein